METSVAESYSGGEREETSLAIQLPLRALFIARPLQLALSSAFYCLKREGKQGAEEQSDCTWKREAEEHEE